ncbi:hypothetical protein F5884DRAFT_685707, partial [Xylogone sp. PMI_703]
IFQRTHTTIPHACAPIPYEVYKELGNDVETQAIISAYFFSIHPWMTFISQKAIYQEFAISPPELGPCTVLLILCMKLICLKPLQSKDIPRAVLYKITKKFFAIVESYGISDISLLQAAILITLHEVSHAVYPHTYLSIGHCAKISQAIRINDIQGVPQMMA